MTEAPAAPTFTTVTPATPTITIAPSPREKPQCAPECRAKCAMGGPGVHAKPKGPVGPAVPVVTTGPPPPHGHSMVSPLIGAGANVYILTNEMTQTLKEKLGTSWPVVQDTLNSRTARLVAGGVLATVAAVIIWKIIKRMSAKPKPPADREGDLAAWEESKAQGDIVGDGEVKGQGREAATHNHAPPHQELASEDLYRSCSSPQSPPATRSPPQECMCPSEVGEPAPYQPQSQSQSSRRLLYSVRESRVFQRAMDMTDQRIATLLSRASCHLPMLTPACQSYPVHTCCAATKPMLPYSSPCYGYCHMPSSLVNPHAALMPPSPCTNLSCFPVELASQPNRFSCMDNRCPSPMSGRTQTMTEVDYKRRSTTHHAEGHIKPQNAATIKKTGDVNNSGPYMKNSCLISTSQCSSVTNRSEVKSKYSRPPTPHGDGAHLAAQGLVCNTGQTTPASRLSTNTVNQRQCPVVQEPSNSSVSQISMDKAQALSASDMMLRERQLLYGNPSAIRPSLSGHWGLADSLYPDPPWYPSPMHSYPTSPMWYGGAPQAPYMSPSHHGFPYSSMMHPGMMSQPGMMAQPGIMAQPNLYSPYSPSVMAAGLPLPFYSPSMMDPRSTGYSPNFNLSNSNMHVLRQYQWDMEQARQAHFSPQSARLHVIETDDHMTASGASNSCADDASQRDMASTEAFMDEAAAAHAQYQRPRESYRAPPQHAHDDGSAAGEPGHYPAGEMEEASIPDSPSTYSTLQGASQVLECRQYCQTQDSASEPQEENPRNTDVHRLSPSVLETQL